MAVRVPDDFGILASLMPIHPLLFCLVLALLGTVRGDAEAAATESNSPAASASGQYLIQQWTSDDGLPQNSVLSFAQTTDGYLWLSTFGGVTRFDGVRFETFPPEQFPDLSRFFLCLSADRDNGLWMSQSDGPVMYGSQGRFQRRTAEVGLPETGGARVSVAPDGKVWAGVPDGRLLRWEGQRFIDVSGPPKTNWGQLWQLVFDARGRIWTEQRGEYAYFDGKGWHPVEGTGFGRTASGVLPLPDGSMILQAAAPSLQLLRFVDGRLEPHFPLPSRRTGSMAMYRQRDGTLWALNLGPLWRREAGGDWESVGESTPLASNVHRGAFEDREGNFWVGTDGAGLFRLRRRAVRTVGTAEGLSRPVVLSVAAGRDGEILTAVHGRGLQRFDGHRFHQDSRPPLFNENQLAWCVWPEPDGSAWVGTYGLGLYHLPPSGPPKAFQSTNTPGLVGGPLSVLLGDSQGNLWIGGDEGLSRRAPDGTFRRWTRAEGMTDTEIGAVAEDGEGGAWVGGEHGLNRITETTVRTYSRADGLAHEGVRCLFRQTNGTLWIGGIGLTRYRDGKFIAIRARDGLPAATLKSLIADDHGFLWWGTARGVFRCSLRELDDFAEGRRSQVAPTRLHRADGMPSNECSGAQPAVWKGTDGRLWFATLNGLAVIDPGNLPRNTVPPPVVIEDAMADGRELDPQQGRVVVPPGTLLTEFRFTALSFVAAEGNRFRCRLEGLDASAREMGTTRTVSYTRLGPGDYTLRVAAANSDGVWNETGATLVVTVQPFFWQTLAFRLAATVTGLAGVAAVVRWFSQRRLLRQVAALERDQAVNRERARIARNMHDDVGASLTQIGLLSDLARRQLSDRQATEARLDELGDLSREVVRNLDAMVWTVDPEHDSVASLVEYLSGFAQEFVRSAGLSFRVDLPPELPGDPVPAATRHHVLLLVKEALNNALKHSGASEITVRAETLADGLRLEILDNGRGFDLATAGRFNDGLGNMRERARLAGGTCTITSQPGSGTRVAIDLPRSRD